MTAALSTNRGRSGVFAILGLVGLLGAASVFVQMTRDRWYHTDKPAEQILYVRSPETVRRMALSYDALAADVYWIRAVQHFGGARLGATRRTAVSAAGYGDCAGPALQHRLPVRIAVSRGDRRRADRAAPIRRSRCCGRASRRCPEVAGPSGQRASSTTSATTTTRRPRSGSSAAAKSRARSGS